MFIILNWLLNLSLIYNDSQSSRNLKEKCCHLPNVMVFKIVTIRL